MVGGAGNAAMSSRRGWVVGAYRRGRFVIGMYPRGIGAAMTRRCRRSTP